MHELGNITRYQVSNLIRSLLLTIILRRRPTSTHKFKLFMVQFMATRRSFSPFPSLSPILSPWICLLFLLSLSCISATHASPLDSTPHISSTILRRDKFIIENSTGTPQVIDPGTGVAVPQGPATDAGGTDLNTPALIWLSFSFAVGVPMSLAGFRGWRLSTGVGVGLAAAIASWAALINSIGPFGISDLIISVIVLGFFGCGFLFGVLEFGRIVGTTLLGITGGLAFGIRIMILKSNLLLSGSSLFPLNWALIAIFGTAGGVSLMWRNVERTVLLLGCASIGTFLTCLGVDLVINKQRGMSRGLRFLFDRNQSHFLDIIGDGYVPPLITQIIIGASLAATPILALGQHFLFKQPFRRRRRRLEDEDIEDDFIEQEEGGVITKQEEGGSSGPLESSQQSAVPLPTLKLQKPQTLEI